MMFLEGNAQPSDRPCFLVRSESEVQEGDPSQGPLGDLL